MAETREATMEYEWAPLSVRSGGREALMRYRVLDSTVSDVLEPMLAHWISATVVKLLGGTFGARRINSMLRREAINTDNGGIRVQQRADYLDVVDAVLYLVTSAAAASIEGFQAVQVVGALLDEGGSLYRVDRTGPYSRLCERVDATAVAQAEQQLAMQGTPADYLREAWRACYQRHPDNEVAFDKAVEAIEAAARPVVSPSNARATLGTMIADLRNKPAKWSTALGSVEQLVARLEALWTVQPRHGEPDPTAVRTITSDQARAAVHEAVTLVNAFTSGLIVAVQAL